MKQLKDLTTNELKTLFKNNKAIQNKAYELAYDNAMNAQAEEFENMGAGVFEYHDDHSSFFLTTPKVYGAKAPEMICDALHAEYLNEENGRLYKKLIDLYTKMQDAEEWDEDREEYDEMIEVCDKLAEGITSQLRAYEDYDENDALEALKDAIEYGTMGDWQIDDDGVVYEHITKFYK